MSNIYEILAETLELTHHFGRLRRRYWKWENDLKPNIIWVLDCEFLRRYRDQWPAVLNTLTLRLS